MTFTSLFDNKDVIYKEVVSPSIVGSSAKITSSTDSPILSTNESIFKSSGKIPFDVLINQPNT